MKPQSPPSFSVPALACMVVACGLCMSVCVISDFCLLKENVWLLAGISSLVHACICWPASVTSLLDLRQELRRPRLNGKRPAWEKRQTLWINNRECFVGPEIEARVGWDDEDSVFWLPCCILCMVLSWSQLEQRSKEVYKREGWQRLLEAEN